MRCIAWDALGFINQRPCVECGATGAISMKSSVADGRYGNYERDSETVSQKETVSGNSFSREEAVAIRRTAIDTAVHFAAFTSADGFLELAAKIERYLRGDPPAS